MTELESRRPVLLMRSEERRGLPAHGRFMAYADGRNIVVELEGPWNVELATDFWRQGRALFPVLDAGGPWATTTIIRRSAMLSPEGFAGLREQMRTNPPNRQVAAALVIGPEVEGHGLVEDLYLKSHNGRWPVAMFEDIGSARAWIARHVVISDPFAPAAWVDEAAGTRGVRG